MSQLPRIVVGSGTSAVLSVARLLSRDDSPIVWISGTGAQVVPVVPVVRPGMGSEILERLAHSLGIEVGEGQLLDWAREYRNKSFRSVEVEALGDVESRFFPSENPDEGADAAIRWDLTVEDIQTQLRTLLLTQTNAVDRVRFIEKCRLLKVSSEAKSEQGDSLTVVLSNGESFQVSQVIWADHWKELKAIEGMPTLKWSAASVQRDGRPEAFLQVVFEHQPALSAEVREGFVLPLQREAGEENNRLALGYFSGQGQKSIWTVFIPTEEGEDNHAIARRLRRLKQALNKAFAGSSWLPHPSSEDAFMETVCGESVRFEDPLIFSTSKLLPFPWMGDAHGRTTTDFDKAQWILLTDGQGVGFAAEAVAQVLGLPAKEVVEEIQE